MFWQCLFLFRVLLQMNIEDIVPELFYEKRVYYCQRCLNHGLEVKRKNHKAECTYRYCVCNDCQVSGISVMFLSLKYCCKNDYDDKMMPVGLVKTFVPSAGDGNITNAYKLCIVCLVMFLVQKTGINKLIALFWQLCLLFSFFIFWLLKAFSNFALLINTLIPDNKIAFSEKSCKNVDKNSLLLFNRDYKVVV